MCMKRASSKKRNIPEKRNKERGPKKLYFWLLWGFVLWFFAVFFLFRGISDEIVNILSIPAVPDWVVPSDNAITKKVKELTQGHPIEMMSAYIGRFDETTAAYLVAIANKESNWGKRVPVLNGEDCYNYWGFRDPDNTRGSGGHSCFESPEEAVRIVGKRIHELVDVYERDTPQEMVVWKCGSQCNAEEALVKKWISDISYYYDKFLDISNKEQE